MKAGKLFSLAPSTFMLPTAVEVAGKVHSTPAAGVPLMRWPDGRWCFPANTFMLKLYRQGLTHDDKGGTLGTYAAALTHLIRFCFANGVDFIDLTDQQFTLFMRALHGERRTNDPDIRVREPMTTRAIGHVCLGFLSHVGSLYGDPDFVGPDGIIRATLEQKSFKGFSSLSWHHPSFPLPSEEKRRVPISTNQIAELQNAVFESSATTYQRLRRYVMIRLLEITGGRRSEVALLTVNSVVEATRMAKPALKMCTKKRGDNKMRLVPISRHDAQQLLDFVQKVRARVIKRTCGAAKDGCCP